MLIIKTFHVFFVVSWFACLFYLPRLFVNHAAVNDEKELAMLTGMESRLIKMMRFTFWGTVVSAVLLVYAIAQNQWQMYIQQGWFMIKMLVVIILVLYHHWCIKIHHNFVLGKERRSHVWFRVFNEVPAVLLLLAIYLVIAKPF